MPDPPSGLPFNARPQAKDLRNFLKKYKDLPRLGVPLPIDNFEMLKDYKEVRIWGIYATVYGVYKNQVFVSLCAGKSKYAQFCKANLFHSMFQIYCLVDIPFNC
jgi:hypothetical protein